MLSKEEAQKIAAIANILRPDWSIAQVMGVLGKDEIRTKRVYRDTAIAITALACDPASRQPTRLLESGPWWESTRPANAQPVRAIPRDECIICGHGGGWALHDTTDHEFSNPLIRRRSETPTPEQRAVIDKVIADAKLAATAAREAHEKAEPAPVDEVLARHTIARTATHEPKEIR